MARRDPDAAEGGAVLPARQHHGPVQQPGSSIAIGATDDEVPRPWLEANGSFQFVEGEYMKAEDYDAFIEDPADW